MSRTPPSSPRKPALRRRPATSSALRSAARLGTATAEADLGGQPAAAADALARWKRLRARADGPGRQVLRVAFDAAYGQAVHRLTSAAHPAADRPTSGRSAA